MNDKLATDNPASTVQEKPLAWHASQIKASQSNKDAKEENQRAENFSKSATAEDKAMVALQKSNMLSLLKEEGLVPQDAQAFTFDDVKEYSSLSLTHAKFQKLTFEDGKVSGSIERANGFRSAYDNSHLVTAIRAAAIGSNVSGITKEALDDYSKKLIANGALDPRDLKQAELLKHENFEAGVKFEESLSQEVDADLVESRKSNIPYAQLAMAYPSAGKVIADANVKLTEIDTTVKNSYDEMIAAQKLVAETSKQELSKVLDSIENSDSFKNSKDTALHIAVNDARTLIASKKGTEDYDALAIFKKLTEAATDLQASITEVDQQGNPQVISERAGKPVVEHQLLSTFISSHSSFTTVLTPLVTEATNKESAYKTSIENAKSQTTELLASVNNNLKEVAETDVANGDSRLKATLENVKDGKYPIYLTNEEVKYATSAIKLAYDQSFIVIKEKTEAEIAALNNPFITEKLNQAKLLEGKFQAGSQEFFSAIGKTELDSYLSSSGLSKDEQQTIRQAAGYINYMYARNVTNDGLILMTGAEATTKAHYLEASRSNTPDSLVLNTARVREYEALNVGKDQFRHEQRLAGSGKNQFGPELMQNEFDKRQESGKSALESFDVVVSDVAGKALANYTHGLRRIQRNFEGFVHKNATTEGLLQVGAFLAGQWVGGRLMSAIGVSRGAASAASGGGFTN